MVLSSLILAVACSREPQTLAVISAAGDPVLQHHEILPDQLPAPFATPSADNSPLEVSQPSNVSLHVPPGFNISVWASSINSPRTMIQAPNGDVFVAETGAGKIEVFRDTDGNGIPDKRYVFATGLDEPFGLAFHANYLYVGDTDAVLRFPYATGQTAATGSPEVLASLPPGGHSTRGIVFNRDHTKMYVSIGSASNVDPETDPMRAAIVEFNPDGSGKRIFASGLRNPVAMAWEPVTGSLWTVVNERDGLGDDLVPDYATAVQDGSFYGWPYAYIGPNRDPRRNERPDLIPKAVVPSLLFQSHSAPLGIAFYDGAMFPSRYNGSAFVALHGSWNRSKRTGYKIVNIPMQGGLPAGGYDDFVVGWMLDETNRNVWGRPVSLLVLRDGSLLISDDGAGRIWRVTYTGSHERRRIATVP